MAAKSWTKLNPRAGHKDSASVELTEQSPAFDLFVLVHAHQAEIWRYLRYQGCDPSRADEFTQDTFLAVHARPFELRSTAETRAYLRRVARNLMLKHRRRAEQGPRFVDLEEADRVWCAEGETAQGDEYRSALRRCLTGLGERPRQVLELIYGEGMGRREVAQRLAMGEQGVKTLLRRVKAKLRECIERRLTR